MNSTPESTGRDVFAEIDELANTMRTVLKAVGNMGEEVIHYRESWKKMTGEWNKTAEELSGALVRLGEGFKGQKQVNETVNDCIAESLKVATSLQERIFKIEIDFLVPLANATANFEERISVLENGPDAPLKQDIP